MRPLSFAQHIVQAVAEKTSEPIMEMVYSNESFPEHGLMDGRRRYGNTSKCE
jgi:hypothetical protein